MPEVVSKQELADVDELALTKLCQESGNLGSNCSQRLNLRHIPHLLRLEELLL